MAFLTDPVEQTAAYRAVVADVDRAATEAVTASGARPGRDFRHAFWCEKKRLLMMVHGVYWRTPAERRAELLRSVRRGVVEGGLILLVGGGLSLGAAWATRAGLLSERTYFVIVSVLFVILVAYAVWVVRQDIAAHAGLYDWDDEADAPPDTRSHD